MKIVIKCSVCGMIIECLSCSEGLCPRCGNDIIKQIKDNLKHERKAM